MNVYSVTNPNHISWLAFQLPVHHYLTNSDFEFNNGCYKHQTDTKESILVWYDVNLVYLEVHIKGFLEDGIDVKESLIVESNTTLDDFKLVLHEVYQILYPNIISGKTF